MEEWGGALNERPLPGRCRIPHSENTWSGREAESLAHPLRAVASTPDDSEFCSFEGRGPRGNVPPDADDEGLAEPTGGNGVTPQAGMTGPDYAGESGVLPHDESRGGGGRCLDPGDSQRHLLILPHE